jgi:hypothetical protein
MLFDEVTREIIVSVHGLMHAIELQNPILGHAMVISSNCLHMPSCYTSQVLLHCGAGCLGDLHRFDPSVLRWSTVDQVEGAAPLARYGHSFVGAGGKLYVLGGVCGDWPYTEGERGMHQKLLKLPVHDSMPNSCYVIM